MGLEKLIDKQKIIIDDHKRGTGEVKDWDLSSNDIHIDKTTKHKIEGKIQNVQIRVPINSNRPINVENKQGGSIPKTLQKEIKRAFENKRKREKFINDLSSVLENYHSTLSNIDKLRDALAKISKHFGLEWTQREVIIYRDEALKYYSQLHTNPLGKEYYILIHTESIELGDIDEINRDNFDWKSYDR